MTLTTMDEGLCKLIEPGVCTTRKRVAVLKECQKRGIPTVVWLCPILPWLNDTAENIRGIVESCAEAGVMGIVHFGMGVTLRDGSREHYYTQLDRKFPGIKERTIRTYGSAYELRSAHHRELSDLFHALCAKYGIWHDNDRIFHWLSRLEEPEQLRFWEQEAI
jgi:DNA repair photolyase